MLRKISVSVWTCCVAMSVVLPTAAQVYPDKAVKIIVPNTPGGGNDVVGRFIAAKLAEKWKQPVVVENKAGAAGNIGALYVSKAANDGYTLMIASDGPMAINAALYKKLPFHPIKDFTALASLASFEFVLVVNKDSAVKTVEDYKRLSQEKFSAQQQFAMGAVAGSTSHLAGALIERALKAQWTTIGYKGAPEATFDVMGGRLDGLVVTIASIAPQVNSGVIKGVVTTGEKRSRLLPSVPTLIEAGLPLSISSWFGLFGPANMPPALVRQINEDIALILRDPDTQMRMVNVGLDALETSLPTFQATLQSSFDTWGTIVREIGVTMD